MLTYCHYVKTVFSLWPHSSVEKYHGANLATHTGIQLSTYLMQTTLLFIQKHALTV